MPQKKTVIDIAKTLDDARDDFEVFIPNSAEAYHVRRVTSPQVRLRMEAKFPHPNFPDNAEIRVNEYYAKSGEALAPYAIFRDLIVPEERTRFDTESGVIPGTTPEGATNDRAFVVANPDADEDHIVLDAMDINATVDSLSAEKRLTYYTRDWEFIIRNAFARGGANIPTTDQLEYMIQVAAALQNNTDIPKWDEDETDAKVLTLAPPPPKVATPPSPPTPPAV